MLPKEMRRVLGAVAVAGALLVVGCGGSNPAPANNNGGGGGGGGGTTTRAAYVGVTVCAGCHAETAAAWEGTKHSGALATLTAIGQGGNARCLGCHTVAMGQPGGFVDVATTPNLVNVQCESCHGPGGEHAGAPSKTNIVRLVPSSTCGGCHTGTHHPQYEEWQQSKKSDSLPDAHADSCVQCHTAEGFVYALGAPTEPHVEERQDGQPATTDLECWSCHNPHENAAGTVHQLRKPVNELCIQCHTAREERTTPGTRVHNPQGDVLTGAAGYRWDGSRYQRLSLPSVPVTHAQATNGDCSICHVYGYPSTNDVGENVNNTGHHFYPNLQACSENGCHSNLARQEVPGQEGAVEEGASEGVLALFNQTQAAVDARLGALRSRVNAIDVNALTVPQKGAYDVAKWNLDVCNADKSHGIHNLQYYNLMMDEAERILNDVLPAPAP